MAIRLELPPALFPRLQQQWQITCTYFQKQSHTARIIGIRTVKAPGYWWRGFTLRYHSSWSLKAKAQARKKQDLLMFEEKYEELVDLLCWAAKEGVQAERSQRYVLLRQWMCANYRKVRSTLRPYWVQDGMPEACDPFESLFVAESIEAFINAPNGIDDLMLSRIALEAFLDTGRDVPH